MQTVEIAVNVPHYALLPCATHNHGSEMSAVRYLSRPALPHPPSNSRPHSVKVPVQSIPVPLPLYTSICENVLVVAPGGIGQVHFGALQELGNEVCSHSQAACARQGLHHSYPILQQQVELLQYCRVPWVGPEGSVLRAPSGAVTLAFTLSQEIAPCMKVAMNLTASACQALHTKESSQILCT